MAEGRKSPGNSANPRTILQIDVATLRPRQPENLLAIISQILHTRASRRALGDLVLMTGKIQTDKYRPKYTNRYLDVEYRMMGSELASTIQKRDRRTERNDLLKHQFSV